MELVIMCTVTHAGTKWKEKATLIVEYESKDAFMEDFMKLAISYYKKLSYNYGRQSYFDFLGLCFEACDYYFIYSDGTPQESPPTVLTLEEWSTKYKIPRGT